MTYPDVSASKDLSLEQLSEILKTVDLGYLLEREDVLTKEVNWDEELSLGEKQRLAIARLVHHRPKFAVLDVSLLRVQSSCLRLWSPDGQAVSFSVGVHVGGEQRDGAAALPDLPRVRRDVCHDLTPTSAAGL